ncbi:unnamed protein product [Echinostoma caproni]|uniref:Leucine-rich repeat-containing protein 34 n=1 Tax=Echinostoma caproni TaxID=27848 RepID=A0A183A8P5_9TREM|nr:unnamed protein product [Echinostoma caproni]
MYQENIGLRAFNFSWNPLVNKAGTELARAIRENSSLTDLTIRDCRIEDNVAEAIGQALFVGSAEDSKLQSLDLRGNPISTSGVLRLLNQINRIETTKLTKIRMEDISFDCPCMRMIETIEQKLPNLYIVHGPELIVGNTVEDVKSAGGQFADLFSLLRLGIRFGGKRLVDALMDADTEGAQTVTVSQFVEALTVRCPHRMEENRCLMWNVSLIDVASCACSELKRVAE